MKELRRGKTKIRKRPTADELLFQPWFLSAEITQAIRVLIPPGYQSKMRDYFDVYGCMRCTREGVVYQANGFCRLCHNLIRIRIRKCIQRRLEGSQEIMAPGVFVGASNKARKLLQGISHGHREAKPLPRNQRVPQNPALDAYKTLIDAPHLPSMTGSTEQS
jgi:hypothetical protein